MLGCLRAETKDNMVSFDVVSFFTRKQIREALVPLYGHFEEIF
jgi:hypothetical protein